MLRLLGPGNDLEMRLGVGIGGHCIVDFWGASHLTDVTALRCALETASNVAGATLLKIFLHEFDRHGGVTGVALLAESHISIHTWPEKGYAALDIFTCGGHADPRRALNELIKQLKPTHVYLEHIVRGVDRVSGQRFKKQKASH
jgi:S-adenosylmethionine decarboxylase